MAAAARSKRLAASSASPASASARSRPKPCAACATPRAPKSSNITWNEIGRQLTTERTEDTEILCFDLRALRGELSSLRPGSCCARAMQAILFDLDGTLIDTIDLIVASW